MFEGVPFQGNSQGISGSPYSRFGIGTFTFQGNIMQAAMGRSGIASFAYDRHNVLNPASLGFDSITTIETGAAAEVYQLRSDSLAFTGNDVTLNYFNMAFPISKGNSAMGFGIAPFSLMNFTASEVTTPSGCNCGNTLNTYTGEGGINRFFMALGFAPFGKKRQSFFASDSYREWSAMMDSVSIENSIKKFRFLEGLSVGINASWLFGTIDYSRSVVFIDSSAFLANRKSAGYTLGDFYLQAGLHYHFTSRRGITYSSGFTVFPKQKVKTSYQSLWYTYRELSSFEIVRDTVEQISDRKSITRLPLGFAAGIMISKANKWTIAADFSKQQWSTFRSEIDASPLRDNFIFSAGCEFIPDFKSLNYLNKISYRAGAYYHSSALQLNETVIKDIGISFGLGLPVIKKDRIQRTMIQIGLEAGKSGTTANGLIEQRYLRFHFGLTLNELWFFKRKYE